MKTLLTAGAVLAIAGAASATELQKLVIIDLTVPNQVTVTATDGVSFSDASGSDVTGIYLENFYGGAGDSLSASLVSGDFTNFENPSDNSPSLFRAGAGADPGLNIWSFSSDTTVTFTAGGQAFIGSATWNLDPNEYANMIAGGERGGDLYFPADDVGDLPGAVLLGTWNVIIPTPGTAGLLGLAGLAAVRRRR
jgi:hypothetical protein